MESLSTLALLTEFKQLLLEEKDVLIKNDGERLQEIVKEKEQYIAPFDVMNISADDQAEARQLLQDIQDLQETNLTLTKQAMSFGQSLIKALQKGSAHNAVTYSKQGKNSGTKGPGLLDQSL